TISCRLLSSAWPICRLPVTLGGGLTMVKGVASGRAGRNNPLSSQWAYHRASIAAGSKVLARVLAVSLVITRRAFASALGREQRLPQRHFVRIACPYARMGRFQRRGSGGADHAGHRRPAADFHYRHARPQAARL